MWAAAPGRARAGSGCRPPGHTLAPLSSGLAWLFRSRAAPPGRSLGGGASPPGPPAPPGLDHAPAAAAPQSLRPGAAAGPARPSPSPGAAANRRPGPGLLPAPPRPPGAHRSCIQRPRAQRRAPAAGSTRRVCLGSANGAIVPPLDPVARLSSQPRKGIRGCLGNGVAWWW